MESTKSRGGMMTVLVALVMVTMVANEINAQIYTCWGGCYNQCILRAMRTKNGTSNVNEISDSNGTSTTNQPPPQTQSPLQPQPPPQTQSPLQPQSPPRDMFSCYYQCLNGCVPRSSGDYSNYCQIGCNLNRCPPNRTHDGAELEKCYSTCADLCKNM